MEVEGDVEVEVEVVVDVNVEVEAEVELEIKDVGFNARRQGRKHLRRRTRVCGGRAMAMLEIKR